MHHKFLLMEPLRLPLQLVTAIQLYNLDTGLGVITMASNKKTQLVLLPKMLNLVFGIQVMQALTLLELLLEQPT